MNHVAQRVEAYFGIISRAAERHGLPPAIVAGVVCQECGGEPFAGRYEPKYRWLVKDALDNPAGDWKRISRATRVQWQKTSWGPMQVMGAVAIERGLTELPTTLCQWDVGLEFGCRQLAWCLGRRGGDMAAALLRYNGGGDTAYPSKILKWAENF